tara:strand:+ start:73 stop:567 length:495 start_codon:yes stop_codon:yes gene_type:complete
MKKIDLLLEEYGSSHKNKINKLIHWICVPAIFFSIVALIWSIPLGPLENLKINDYQYINWATIALVFVVVYYIKLSPLLTIGMIIFSTICLYVTNYLENLIFNGKIEFQLWLIALIIFVVSWIIQFIGHEIEGKKPSFLKDVQFLLIGPAWLMHFIYKKINISY